MSGAPLGLPGIIRVGLVQTALGAIVVLTTSTLNRVMVVEFALPATIPGALVALHYAVQVLRPRWGHGADKGGKQTPWIIGGMGVLALSGIGAALATVMMGSHAVLGVALAVVAFFFIGVGVGAAGTSVLVLLAKSVDPSRRAAAATIVWTMMIIGFIVTAMLAGYMLDPFSPTRLVLVSSGVAVIAFLVAVVALWGVEKRVGLRPLPAESPARKTPFREALAQVWSEPQSRRFAVFVLVSMLAYSAQDLILEPFAGMVFHYTPGESTRLAGIQHTGVLIGMVGVGLIGSMAAGRRLGSMKVWTIGGCIASGFSLIGLSAASLVGPDWPLRTSVFVLGMTNGAYAVAAIGSMMGLASTGHENREGVRMGLWGAAQAIAFGLGGFLGTLASDVARYFLGSPITAYATVFALEAVLFFVAAALAFRVYPSRSISRPAEITHDKTVVAPVRAQG